MGLREQINENPRIAIGAIVGVIVLTIVWAVVYLRSGGASKPGTVVVKAYFSEDDGASFFPDSIDRVPGGFTGPKGNTAVRAAVFEHAGEKAFVGWLESYTPKGQQFLSTYYGDAAKQKTPPPDVTELNSERLVKKPGGEKWVGVKSPQFWQVQDLPRKNGDLPVRKMP